MELPPLPGGRRRSWPERTPRVGVLGGAPVCKPTFRATPRGRRPGEWQQFTVSVPGRCGTVYTAPRDVFPILHCESSSGQPRGTRTACVLVLAAGAERAFFNSQPSI